MDAVNKVVKGSPVKLELEGELAIITIDNPPVNALNAEIMEELDRVFDQLADLNEIRAAVITGAGDKAFVAGADIRQFPGLDEASGRELALTGQAVLDKIGRLNLPVICAINGFALGGGCELALACDIRVASVNAKLGLPEVSLGVIPGYGGTQRMARLIGGGKAKELIFSGDYISAEEACRNGLVEKLVPVGEALPEAKAFARKITGRAPLAVAKAKQAINQGLQMTLRAGQDLEARLFAELCTTGDKHEGVLAFMEKRLPKFKGR